jgi:glycosyltransferase involved in cell wall biosynthesis
VPFTDLAQLYDAAHLYVQPSVEEGFCITALDAAAAGLPVIASPAGALARIAEVSGGTLVDSEPGMLAQAVADFVLENRWADVTAQAQAVRNAFSWDAAARALMERYASLIKQRVSNHA